MQLVELLLLVDNCYLFSITDEQEMVYGQFVLYHMLTGQWYRNDDSRQCNDPILQQIPAESVDVLFFKSDF